MKVEAVIEVQNKVSKAGKPYTLSTFTTDDGSGKEIQGFGKAEVGMTVTDVEFNKDYSQWQGKLLLPDKHTEVMDALRVIFTDLQEIKKHLKPEGSGYAKFQTSRPKLEPDTADPPEETEPEEAPNIDGIPF